MNYIDRYYQFRDEVWAKFEDTVKKGAVLFEITEVTYPRGINVKGLSKTTNGDCWFYAKSIIANPKYVMHLGEDIIIGTGKVTFVDIENKHHSLEPDIVNLDWLCKLIDNTKPVD